MESFSGLHELVYMPFWLKKSVQNERPKYDRRTNICLYFTANFNDLNSPKSSIFNCISRKMKMNKKKKNRNKLLTFDVVIMKWRSAFSKFNLKWFFRFVRDNVFSVLLVTICSISFSFFSSCRNWNTVTNMRIEYICVE